MWTREGLIGGGGEKRRRQGVCHLCVVARDLVAQYDLAIRAEDGTKPSSHRNDLFMAVYLPTDEFVSETRSTEPSARDSLALKLTTRVRWYREFRDSFEVNVVGLRRPGSLNSGKS